MLIIWGTKVVRKSRGRTADFCLLCRDFQPIRVVQVESVGHIYYIPLGSRTRHGYELTCESCGLSQSNTDPYAVPATSLDRHADTDTLLADTNPDARRTWASRLATEDRIRAGGLAPEERPAALFESFLLANGLLAKRSSGMHFDAVSGLACFGTIAAVVGTAVVANSLGMQNETVGSATLTVGVVLGLFTLVLLATDLRRYARRKVLPILIRAIRPFRPSQEENEATLQALRDRKYKLGKLLRADEIEAALMVQSY